MLHELLTQGSARPDSGKDLLPPAVSAYNAQAYLFQDYWEDIGTIEAFYQANLALTAQPEPLFSFYDEQAPIYTRPRYLVWSNYLNLAIPHSLLRGYR